MSRQPRCPTCDRITRDYAHRTGPAGLTMGYQALRGLFAIADEFDAVGELHTAREFVEYLAPDVTHLRRHA